MLVNLSLSQMGKMNCFPFLCSQQDALLNDLKVDLPLMTNLQFASTQVELISGKQEGIYAWIAINYVLNKFDHSFGGN